MSRFRIRHSEPHRRLQHPKWRRPGSNRQPPPCKSGALPIELRPRKPAWRQQCTIAKPMPTHELQPLRKQVGALGFEPRTSALSGLRSNQLSYAPAIQSIAWESSRQRRTPQRYSRGASSIPQGRRGRKDFAEFLPTCPVPRLRKCRIG